MKVAFGTSPLTNDNKFRGSGYYVENLKNSILKYDKDIEYSFFNRIEDIPDNIDLVHFPYFDPFFLTLPKFKKTKTIVTVYDLIPLIYPKFFPSGLKGKLRWMLQKKRLTNIDNIITISNASKKDLIK